MNTYQQVLPGVYHIQDPMDVCMTLLVGSRRALLVDTGYGLTDVRAFVRTLTDLPLQVVLTHAHHDHAAGAVWFDRVWVHRDELPCYALYTDREHRRNVARQAREKGLSVPDDYADRSVAEAAVLETDELDLGGLTARLHPCPGHTPGSLVVEVPERGLLLSGDNWNPCTWAFFPETPGVTVLRRNMRRVLELPFTQVLCSHQPCLFPRRKIDDFYARLTDEALLAAPAVDMGWPVDTHCLKMDDGQFIVFDRAKVQRED